MKKHLVLEENRPVQEEISIYKWKDNGYEPKTDITLVYNEYKLSVNLVCREMNPLSLRNADDEDIWCDSCMEVFLKPYEDDDRYINFEINSLGFMIMGFGVERERRTSVVKENKPLLNLAAEVDEISWRIKFDIPFEMLKKIYAKQETPRILRANFYKCGDETSLPHFGMWSEIDSDKPDFHCPDYFGKIELSKGVTMIS